MRNRFIAPCWLLASRDVEPPGYLATTSPRVRKLFAIPAGMHTFRLAEQNVHLAISSFDGLECDRRHVAVA